MKIKVILVSILLIFMLIVIFQNAAVIPVNFLLWQIDVSLILLLFAALLVGFVAGSIKSSLIRKKKSKSV